jgi:hypothetical protein
MKTLVSLAVAAAVIVGAAPAFAGYFNSETYNNLDGSSSSNGYVNGQSFSSETYRNIDGSTSTNGYVGGHYFNSDTYPNMDGSSSTNGYMN